MRAGDVLLLCSDGLTSMIARGARSAEILGGEAGLDATPADALIAAANEAGGRDNITVVLFRLEDVGGDGASADRRRRWSAWSRRRPPTRRRERRRAEPRRAPRRATVAEPTASTARPRPSRGAAAAAR